MQNILYELDGSLYINLTNKCPCNCDFCLRGDRSGVGDADSLWLEREPTFAEVAADLDKRDLAAYKSVVFCGYGEPTCALDVLVETAKYIKSKNRHITVRLNTNGLGDLINKKPVAPLFSGIIDAVSISLNASDADKYQRVVHSRYGDISFEAMLNFAKQCGDFVPDVVFTVVDSVGEEEIFLAGKVAESVGVTLKVRRYISAETKY